MKKFVLVFAATLFLLNIVAYSQVVNVEKQRIKSDSTGVYGNVKSLVSLIKNTKTLWNLSLSYDVLLDRGKHQWLFLGKMSWQKAENTNLVNKGYEHIRYIYLLSQNKKWNAEVFEQMQFDGIRKIEKRYLTGGGIRYTPVLEDKISVSLGLGAMYEYEKFKESTAQYNWIRMNSYLSLTFYVAENIKFYSVTYYQPLPDMIKENYRIFNNSGVSIKVSTHFSFSLDYEIVYDSFLPEGIPATVYFLKNGLAYKF